MSEEHRHEWSVGINGAVCMGCDARLDEDEIEGRLNACSGSVCMCGSSRFIDIMAVIRWLIERDEDKIVLSMHLLPLWYPDVPAHHLAEVEGCAEHMDRLHLRKIDLADEILVLNVGGYIGQSTRNEINYARSIGTNIRYLEEKE